MKKFFVALFAFIIGISVATGCGGTSTSSTSSSSSSTSQVEDTTLSSISVKTLPYKLNYYSHETINTAGGQIELSFTNNTKQVIDMSDDMINYSSVNMATLGKQNVELRYTYKGITKSTSYEVEIEDSNIYVTNIYLDRDYAEIMVGGGVTLKEIVLPKNATNQAVEWISSDPSIAIVSSQGVVEGLKEGNVVITATAKDKGTKIATATIVVKNPTDDTITVTLRRELTLSLQTVYEKYNSSNYTSSNYEILTGYYNEGIEGISSAKTSTEANAAFVNATRKMALVAVNITTPVVDYAEFSFLGDNLTITSGGLVNPTSLGRSVVANLTIAASVGDEEVTLDGITVTGTTTINGGGSHSVIAVNVVFVGTITIDKDPTTGEETVRVEFSVTTTVIGEVVVADNATLTANTPLSSVTVNATVTTALIQGSSSIGQITSAASIEVDIDGVVDSLEVSSGATSAPTVTINSAVQLITNNYSGAEIKGNGQISNVIATVSTTVAVTVPVNNVELSGGTLTVNQPVNNVVVTASTSVVITGSSTVDYVDVPSTTSGTLSISVANTIVSNQSSNNVNVTETITIAPNQTKLTNNVGDDIVDVTALSDLKKIELAKLERKFAALNSLYYSIEDYSIIRANYVAVKSAINASATTSGLNVAKANIDYIDRRDGTSSGSLITALAYILKIEDNLSASIYRGNSTTLPSSIKVTLKNPNGTTSTNQSVSVTWNSVDQTQLGYGVHAVEGTFAGTYLNSIGIMPRFVLNVANPIAAEFLTALDVETGKLEVATVTRDGDSLTVNFRSDVSSSDVLAGAVGLAEALAEIAGPDSTLTVGDITITLGSATPDEIIELARLLLGDLTPEQFLASTEPITSAYTASIDYEGGTFPLSGTISFTVTHVGTKAEFLAALDVETGKLEVATVTRDGDSLTVNFRSDVEPSDVLAAAEGLATALRTIADGTSTLTVGEGEDALTITLGSATSDEIIELARLLLGDLTPEQFLASTEPITSAYTATIVYENNDNIELDGSLSFTVTHVGTKAEFLAALDVETGKLEVATVTRDGDSLTVNFRSDVEPSDVLAAAEGLATALRTIADGTSTLTVGEGEDALTITLGSATSDEIIELARLLLGDLTPEQFLASTEPITSAYTATIVYENNDNIELDGSLSFTVTHVGTKAEFLTALDVETGKLEVATVTRDGDSLTVNFRSDVSSSDVLAGAVGLAEALAEIAGPDSTLTVGDITITLGSATSDEIIELARLLLGDLTPEQFLASTEPITSAYTATIVYENNDNIELDGSLSFTVTHVGTKAEFLTALDVETGKLEVATVTRDGDSLTVNFRSDVSSSDVLAGAVGLAEALAEIAGPDSTLTVGDITITLGSATPDEIIELARLLLGDLTPEQFLASTEPITSAYTASIDYEGGTFPLSGTISFTVTHVGTKAEFLTALDVETGKLEVATVTRDGDSLTVNFRSDVEPSDVLAAAEGLATALRTIADGTSTLTVGEGEDALTITLGSATSDEIIELARLLLGDLTPEQFLASTEPITSAYTATIVYENNDNIELDGSLSFTVTHVGTKAEFLAALDVETGKLEVATVTRDGDSLTVNFRSDVEPSDVLAAAEGLATALRTIADGTSTLTVGEGEDALTITLGSATSDEIIELARLLLGDLTPEQFLASTEPITSAYTATIVYENNDNIELDGSLSFTVTHVGTKAEFLAALDVETGKLEVATVTRDGDSLTVNFRSDVEPSDVLAAAEGLATALRTIADGTSTLTVGEGEDALTITLGSATSDEIIELARLLLGDLTPEQFLASTEPITSAYTATIVYENNDNIELDGSLSFTVTHVGTKAEFLAALDVETGKLEVATVTRDGDSLTVNFRSDVEPSDVLAAAEGLATALRTIADGTSTLTVGEGEDALTITLGSATSDEIIELARLLLGDLTPEQFLASTEPITSAYTATIVYENNDNIELDGSLSFTVTHVGTKAEFLAALDVETGKLEVATVTRDGDSLTVNFRSDVEPSDVLAAAEGLATALRTIADGTSTLTVGEGEDALTITLGSATSDEIIELARLLLGDLTPEQFLASTEPITSAYTATIVYENNDNIELDGSLSFTVTHVGTKAEFLAALDVETGKLEVATVTRDGDSLTVNFRSDVEPSDVLAAAEGLATALRTIADGTSTLTVGEGEDALTITLGSATSDEIIELARLLLGDLTPEQFLASTEPITSAYTATIVYENNDNIELDGSLSFTVTHVGTKAEFLAALDVETGKLEVATVTRDGDSLTVNFRSDVEPSDVLAAAEGLATALRTIADGTSTLTVGEGEDALTITLGSANADQLIALAQKLLDGKTPTAFLADGVTISSPYTASIDYVGGAFGLSGTISFTAVQ